MTNERTTGELNASLEVSEAENLIFPAALQGKRLLLATESLGPVNGVSRATLSLIGYLRRHGVEVAVLAPHFEVRPGSFAGNEAELRLKGFPLPYNPELKVVYPFRLSRVYLRTFEPDLVYLASPASLGGQVLWQLRNLTNPPVIVNFQTDLAAYARTILPWGINHLTGGLIDWVQGAVFRYPAVRKVLYPSTASRYYLEKLGVPKDKLVMVGRGVDAELFHPSKRDNAWRKELAPNGEIILGCISRMSLEKGFDFLARVAHSLAAENFPFKLVITGGNRNQLVEKSIQHLFGDLTGRQVIFNGLQQGAALARAYASADIFVYPSLTETFGQVIQEAMASGLPVIARKEGGPADIVREGQTGYLIEPYNLSGFVTAVKELAAQPELRREFSLTARRLAGQAVWDAVNNRIAHLFAAAISGANPV